MKEALVYLLAITIAEVLNITIGPVWGITFHIIVLVALILHSALASGQTRQQLLLSLTLVPLVRIISLSMPLANIPQVWWYPIVYIPLLVAAVVVMRILGYSLEQIGFNFRYIPLLVVALPVMRLLDYSLEQIEFNFKRISIQLAVALSGFVFGVVEYFILTEEAQATGLVLQETWLLAAFLLLACTGFVEELIFRGVLQRSAVEAFGWWGIVYTSLLFAIVHLIHQSLIDIAFVFVIALFFGWVVKKTGLLFGVILSHGIANIVLFLVAPLFF